MLSLPEKVYTKSRDQKITGGNQSTTFFKDKTLKIFSLIQL